MFTLPSHYAYKAVQTSRAKRSGSYASNGLGENYKIHGYIETEQYFDIRILEWQINIVNTAVSVCR